MIFIIIGIISGIVTSMGMRRRNNTYNYFNSIFKYESKNSAIY